MKEQTKILYESWDNAFKMQKNANWAKINEVTIWINNNISKTNPFKKVIRGSISIDDTKNNIKQMKKIPPDTSK